MNYIIKFTSNKRTNCPGYITERRFLRFKYSFSYEEAMRFTYVSALCFLFLHKNRFKNSNIFIEKIEQEV